jgi:hypothetical protein
MDDHTFALMATLCAAVIVPAFLIVLGSVWTPRSTKPNPAPLPQAPTTPSAPRIRLRDRLRSLGASLVRRSVIVLRRSLGPIRSLAASRSVTSLRHRVQRIVPRQLVEYPLQPMPLPPVCNPRTAIRHVILEKRVRSKPVIVSLYAGGIAIGRLKVGTKPNRYLSLGELPVSPTMEAEFYERAKQKLAESREADAS